MRFLIVSDPVFRRAIIGRALVVWSGIRGAALFFGIQFLDTWGFLLVFGAVSTAILLDARHRSEDLFLANLGTSRIAIVATVVLTALIGEAALVAALRWIVS